MNAESTNVKSDRSSSVYNLNSVQSCKRLGILCKGGGWKQMEEKSLMKLGGNVTEISSATRRRRSEEKIQNKIKF